jgi:hypothetical protein
MSYDIEVRSDDAYSREVPRDRVTELLRSLGARMDSSPGFTVYEESGRSIEIDFGHEGPGSNDTINFVGLGVPYSFLSAVGERLLTLAFAVAAALEWRVYDPQAGRYLTEGEHQKGMEAQASALEAFDLIGEPAARSGRGLLGRILDRLMRQTKFMIAVALLAFGSITGYAIWESKQETRRDPRIFVGGVLAAASALILIRPVVLALVDSKKLLND